MADFLNALDPYKLILTETALSFISSPFKAPRYNLAIFLFGIYAQENTQQDSQSLQLFTSMVGISSVFDIIWMARHEQNGFIRFITILLLIIKVPTFLSLGNSLRARGAQFGGLSIRGGDIASATVWSMPGGFSSGSRDGYQNVDEELGPETPRQPVSKAPLAPSHTTPPPALGSYQSA